MTRNQPRLATDAAVGVSEDRGRRIVQSRSHGRCEACQRPATDWSHRVPRSQGGTWAVANGLHLCRGCHHWSHQHPTWARTAGLTLPSWADPATERVWLAPATAWAGWWLLDEDGVYVACDTDDPPPAHYPVPHRPVRGVVSGPRLMIGQAKSASRSQP